MGCACAWGCPNFACWRLLPATSHGLDCVGRKMKDAHGPSMSPLSVGNLNIGFPICSAVDAHVPYRVIDLRTCLQRSGRKTVVPCIGYAAPCMKQGNNTARTSQPTEVVGSSQRAPALWRDRPTCLGSAAVRRASTNGI